MFCPICKILFKNSRNLILHCKKEHKISSEECYRLTRMKEGEGVCHLEGCDNKTNFRRFNYGYNEFCCSSHAVLGSQDKIKRSCLEKYGVEHPMKNKKVRDKIIKTKKEKYGDEKYNNKNKIRESLLNRTQSEKDEWSNKVKDSWNKKDKEEIFNIQERRNATYFKKTGQTITENWLGGLNSYLEDKGIINVSQDKENKNKIKNFWENISEEKLKEIREKTKATCLEKYGVEHCMHIEDIKSKIIQKGLKTKREKGSILPEHQIPEYQKYKSKVYYFTNKSKIEKFTKEELQTIGKCGINGAKQVDHIYSIKEGFKNNIDPKIIGSKHNLQLLSWEENDKKNDRSDMTKNKLIELYKYNK